MKISLVFVGETTPPYLKEALDSYSFRIEHYIDFRVAKISPSKKQATSNLGIQSILEREAEQIEKLLSRHSYVVLLDEKGSLFSSPKFASFLQKKMNAGNKELVFVIGGAYGFHQRIYARANELVSLSPMTFPHQLVRVIFAEQLYRACTILKNEQYHHG